MNALAATAILALCAAATATATPMSRVMLNSSDAGGARCLDGSPFGYYLRRSAAADTAATSSSSWIIFLEGGGLCVEPIDCLSRAKSALGSSTKWGATWTPGTDGAQDILSDDVTTNPSFAGFNHVYMPYCSGDTWTGTRLEKDLYGLNFAGHLNLRAAIAHLNATQGFGDTATEILFMGSSAGGIGTFQNADYAREAWFPRRAVVKAAPVSGYYFPSPVISFPQFAFNVTKPAVGWPAAQYFTRWFQSALDVSCAAAHPGSDAHRCWDASFLYKYIDTPLFVVENRFDQNQIEECFFDPVKLNTSKTRGFVRDYGRRMMASMNTTVRGARGLAKGDGLFLTSCLQHTGDFCIQDGPAIAGMRLRDVLPRWFAHGADGAGAQHVDGCNAALGTDDPCNAQCSCHAPTDAAPFALR